jgi:hypothetical protein
MFHSLAINFINSICILYLMNYSQIYLEKQNEDTRKRLIYPPYLNYKEKFIPTVFDVN